MLRLEHIGIAVADVAEAQQILEDVLGRRPYKAETVESEGVRTLFLDTGTAKLELLEALNPESPIAGFIAKRGPGMHHLAFEVEDLDAETERLKELDYQVLGVPRPGADGKRIVFLHPKSTGRVLIELCQQAHFESASDAAPVPATSIFVPAGEPSDALAHALTRHFKVNRDSGTDTVATVSVEAGGYAPRILLDASGGDGPFRINLDAPGAVSMPSDVWCRLPDPWGLIADLIAAKLGDARGAGSA